MIKQKKCCGTGKAKGYGCGKLINVEYRIYGLGKMCCYPDWLINSEPGKVKMQKAILKASKSRLELQSLYDEKKHKTTLRNAFLSTKMAVHKFVRERDKGKECISCGCEWNSDFQAGHFYAAGSFETLRFNLSNINGQCQKCNLFLNGNFDNYSLKLPNRIGLVNYNELIKLAEIDKQFVKVWTIEKLNEIKENIKELTKQLKS